MSISFPLHKGMTSACFIDVGNIPSLIESLNILHKGNDIDLHKAFSIMLLISSYPWLLLLGSHLIKCSTSGTVVPLSARLMSCLGILFMYSSIGVVPGNMSLASFEPNVE